MYTHNTLQKGSHTFPFMRKPLFYSLLVLFALTSLLNSCASKPEEEPIVQEDDGLQNLRDLEEKAKGAIARAESAGAAESSPRLLDGAYLDLRNGQEKNPKTDGGAQRAQYLSAIDKANRAYEESIENARERWLLVISRYEESLDELNAALFMPEYNVRSREALQQLRDKIAEGDNEESLALYQSTIPNVDAVLEALTANLDWLDQLRQQVTGLQGEASRQDLEGEATRFESQGKAAYESALGHRSRGDLHSMEQDLFDARYYFSQALRFSGALSSDRIDAMMRGMQQRLELSSRRKVLDSDGREVNVTPWRGDAYLRDNPLADLNKQSQLAGQRRRDRSRLQEPQVSADFLQTPAPRSDSESADSLSLLAPPQLNVVDSGLISLGSAEIGLLVLSESWQLHPVTQQADDNTSQAGSDELLSDAQLLFQQAVSSWEKGVQARNQGALPKALHYFEESSRLLDQYNVQYAILGYYTVRKLKPEDCLWRIAGYSDIYGDPFQWTRIYQRNRDIISNPSLIYPGQRLVIPPARDR